MKFETLINLVGSAIFGLIGLSALIGAIFFGAWWHFVTFGMCALMAYVLYTDDEYDTESVATFFKRIKSK